MLDLLEVVLAHIQTVLQIAACDQILVSACFRKLDLSICISSQEFPSFQNRCIHRITCRISANLIQLEGNVRYGGIGLCIDLFQSHVRQEPGHIPQNHLIVGSIRFVIVFIIVSDDFQGITFAFCASGNSNASVSAHGKGKRFGLNVILRDTGFWFAEGVGLADVEQAFDCPTTSNRIVGNAGHECLTIGLCRRFRHILIQPDGVLSG